MTRSRLTGGIIKWKKVISRGGRIHNNHTGGNMIYLFEGSDGSGKSTYARSERFEGYEYIHFGAYPSPSKAFWAYEEMLDAMVCEALAGHTHNVVIDRMHISERVYGTVYRNNRMSDSRHWHIDDLLRRLHATVILCQPPLEVVLLNWQANLDDELIKDETKIREIYSMYSNFWPTMTKLPVEIYDYTDGK